jgi:hypothetical protein
MADPPKSLNDGGRASDEDRANEEKKELISRSTRLGVVRFRAGRLFSAVWG